MEHSTTQSALRELRRRRGLSQARLATKSGIARSLIVEIEGGVRGMSVDSALKASRVLQVDPIALYLAETIPALKAEIEGTTGSGAPTKAATVARTLVAAIESGNLSPEQRRAARAAVEDLARMVEEAAAKRQPGTLSSLVRGSGGPGPHDPPQREAEEHSSMMDELGRDSRGLRTDVTGKALGSTPESKKKTKTGERPTDESVPGEDFAYKGRMDDLDRDNFGRRKKGST